jgi:hypothetical protein
MNRRRLLSRGAPLLLVVALGAAVLAPFDEALRVESGNDVAERWATAMERLPEDADVLVGFDPDLGTYAEIRPTVQAVLASLLARQSRLAFVSLTPEGRGLAIEELARLGRNDANMARIADLGFLAGAEAGLVSLTRGLPDPRGAERPIPRRLADEGIATMDAILVVGGNDLGPRSWVEQVLPRIDDVVLLAVAPTVLLPELLPYEATGQVDALVGTAREGAALRGTFELGVYDRLAPSGGPSAAAVLVGLLIAAAVLGHGLLSAMLGSNRERDLA